MRKILIAVIATLCISMSINAQSFKDKPVVFIGFSTGINNQIGLIGPQLGCSVSDNFMVEGGVGLGSWGYKSTVNVQCHRDALNGIFCKLGYAHSTGLPDFETEMELDNGDKEDVMMDLNPSDNLNLTVGNSWQIGGKNRFYLEGGYAIKLTDPLDAYELHDDQIELSSTSEMVMNMLQPGGLIIALGFSFGL